MAYVKINNTELANMATHIQKAFDALDEVEDIWGNKFAELYADFVDSGFLDSLYEDAESTFYSCLRAATSIGIGGGLANVAIGIVACFVPVAGWVAWLVRLLFGVVAYAMQSNPQWLTVSKEAFIQLLRSCKEYQDDNYIRISNLATKFYHMQLSIEKIRSKVDEFQSNANQVGATAEQMGLSTRTGGSDDGILLGIETEIVVDGQTITVDASEAMSAFYTYAYTVTSTMIAADYLERTYGYEIDYLGLVANANAFMADTLTSDMYTPEMIQLLLPQFTTDEAGSYAAASAATGLDQAELQAALGDVAAIGAGPLFAGLIGAGFMGTLKTTPDTGTPPVTNPPTTTPTNPTSPTNPTGPSGGDDDGGGGGTTVTTVAPTDPVTTTPSNEVEIDPIVETDVPIDSEIEVELGVLDDEGNVDYDQLAMEEYQFGTGAEEIEKYRLGLMEQVEALYASGDFSSLSAQLKEFGYGTAEIATIIASKSMTMTAILDGNTRNILAQKAVEMAKADGVENYSSKYTNNPSTSELADDKKPLRTLHVNSDNKELCEMEDTLDGLEETYRTKVDDANKLLDEAEAAKKAVDEIKAKYEKEYGTDTSKWTEEAAKEYDEAIGKYNTSAEAANKAIEEANTAKDSYQKSREEFEKACEDYYLSKVISDEESEQSGSGVETDIPTGDTSTGMNAVEDPVTETPTDQSGFTVNPDGTVSFGSGFTNDTSSGSTSDTSSAGTTTGTSTGTYVSQDDFLASLGLKKDNN